MIKSSFLYPNRVNPFHVIDMEITDGMWQVFSYVNDNKDYTKSIPQYPMDPYVLWFLTMIHKKG